MIEAIKKRIKEVIEFPAVVEVAASEKEDFGHYCTNVAFKLASQIKKTPLEIAKEIAERLKVKAGGRFFSRVETAAPGFINFWITTSELQSQLKEILEKKKLFGVNKVRQPQKINVEFVSANPTGPLTMANGRGGFYGDVLANVLAAAGHKVTREYYINDAGNQIRLLGESILAAEKKIPDKEEYYKGNYIKKLKGKNVKQAAAFLLKTIKVSLKKAGIKHDVWFSEYKKLRKRNELEKTLEFLKKKRLIEAQEGAEWLNGAVLIKSDGSPTYFLADLAYHYDKFIKRKFDLAIDVWGADHHGYAARIKEGVKALGVNPDRLKIIIIQLVRLVSKGKEVRMSKRAGEFVLMDDLLREVGKDAARFFFLMYSPDTHMDFDLDLAKEQSRKNPVYYVQYAYVRCVNILKKVRRSKLGARDVNLGLLNTDSEKKLMFELIKFPDIIAQSAEDFQVHHLIKYALDMAKALHNFYEQERVIGIDVKLEQARLALVSAAKIVLENLFDILGISKLEKM